MERIQHSEEEVEKQGYNYLGHDLGKSSVLSSVILKSIAILFGSPKSCVSLPFKFDAECSNPEKHSSQREFSSQITPRILRCPPK